MPYGIPRVGMLRLFELVGNPRRVWTTFKRIFNIEIIYAHPHLFVC